MIRELDCHLSGFEPKFPGFPKNLWTQFNKINLPLNSNFAIFFKRNTNVFFN